METQQRHSLKVEGEVLPQHEEILTKEALDFLGKLHYQFEQRRRELLYKREDIQKEIASGKRPNFLKETEQIRKDNWTIADLPEDLLDRRVEITGPVDRKMVINGLNSGAKVFMADFEDANSPTWKNTIQGQLNLRDAVNKTISFTNEKGREYRLNDEQAVLIVRPRGWHLEEKHITYRGSPVSASLIDFGLYFFHNAEQLIKNGTGPYFYLPKIENHQEAKLWNDIFIYAQDYLGIRRGTIKATVLLETILAAFEMDEILYELKEHSAGLNCGRWDYIFSYLKKFRHDPAMILPDRSQVTMVVPFMRAYSLLTIQTCHKRNAPAIGGMAAQIPRNDDPKKNEEAFNKVKADKEREVTDGHDGTWVAHPGMVSTAMEVFNKEMTAPNQIHIKREDVQVSEEDLLEIPDGEITEQGLRTNINVGIRYLASWLSGKGAAPIYHLMEDAATAEISRAQIWHWIRHPGGKLEDGRKITIHLVEKLRREEMEKIKRELGEETFERGNYKLASQLFDDFVQEDTFSEFLTLKAYEHLN
ncbi:malate synthase A [Halobacillus salinarum]|uniref:Malate synthase n=1 Tax=Halobacillus salinarum TaxID=2932257 RepID=A0ABY4EPS5_9BACI|nr:malate synthase A [Halobacillus salinarum]UOQ45995.1 malate synthase A [Halobacillus salinarum]